LEPAFSLRWDIDHAFDEFWRNLDLPLRQLMTAPLADVSMPRVNMRDTDKALEITAEIPGVDQEDIDVSVEDGQLTIRAEAEGQRDMGGGRYSVREIGLASVERTIPIPEGLDIDNASASVKNGMLAIIIPKREGAESSPKRISVNEGRT
jgi:HSP20 family protein